MKTARLILFCLLLTALSGIVSCNRDHADQRDYEIYNAIFNEYHSRSISSNISTVEGCILDMIKRAEKDHSRYGKALGYLDMAAYACNSGDLSTMIHYMELANAVIDPSDHPFLLAYNNFVQASIELTQNEPARAVDLYTKGLPVFEQLDDSAMMWKCYINLSYAYEELNEAQEADKYYHKARALNLRLYHDQMLAQDIQSLIRNKQYDEAMDLWRHLGAYNSQGDSVTQYNCNFWIVHANQAFTIRLMQDHLDSAMYYLDQVIDYTIRYSGITSKIKVAITKANLLMTMDHYPQALTILQELDRLDYDTIPQLDVQLSLLRSLIDCHSHLGHYREVNIFHKRYEDVSRAYLDSVVKYRNEISNIEQNYERQLAAAQLESKTMRHRIILISFIALLAILLLLALYQHRRILQLKERDLRIEREQQLQDKELKLAETQMMQAKSQEQILTYTQQMKEIASNMPKQIRTKMMLNLEHIQQQQDKDAWRLFEEGFATEHGDFKQRLVETYPTLNKNDVKICMLLRMGLSTKEVATTLHLNPDSVKTYRQNIRKKIGIRNPEITLEQFLYNF